MKYKNVLFIALSISLFLFGCAQPVPNPIMGTYTMPDSVNQNYDNASLALKADGTFIYVERISTNSQYQLRIDGSYTVSVDSYNFVAADGLIIFTVPDDQIPDRISDLLLKTGANSFLFSWSCDRNNGPIGMTLVTDPDDPTENFEFKYIGSSNKIDREEDILPDWLMPSDPDDDQEDSETTPPEETPDTDGDNPEEDTSGSGDDTENETTDPDDGQTDDGSQEIPEDGNGTDNGNSEGEWEIV